MRVGGVVLLLLVLLGGARRSFRIDDSQHVAQQQNSKLANSLEVSAESQESFTPGGFWMGPRAGAQRERSRQHGRRAGRLGRRRVAPGPLSGPGRARVALQSAPQAAPRRARVSLQDGDAHAEEAALEAERAELAAKRAELEAVRAELVEALSAPAAAPGAAAPTAASLCAVVAEECGARLGDRMEPLGEAIVAAWHRGRSLQRSEIERLRRRVTAAVEIQREEESGNFLETLAAARRLAQEQGRTNKERISIEDVQALADKAGKDSQRELTKATFKFFSQATEPGDEEGDDDEVVVPGEGVVAVNAARTRMRLLERHEAAGCVEYRLFAYALSECDDLEAIASAPSTLDDGLTQKMIGGFLSKWAGSAVIMIEKAVAAEGDAEMAELPFWPDVLIPLLSPPESSRSSGPAVTITIDGDKISPFPVLLLSLASGQGNVELFAIYYLARHLARINLKALAEFEGRSMPARLDQLVSEQEALLLKGQLNNLIDAVGLGAVTSFFLLLLAVGLIVTQLGPVLSNILFPQPDPFDIF